MRGKRRGEGKRRGRKKRGERQLKKIKGRLSVSGTDIINLKQA